MKISDKMQMILTIIALLLIIIGPILTLIAFTDYNSKSILGLIASSLAWLLIEGLWIVTLYLFVTLDFTLLYVGIALPIIGFIIILISKVIHKTPGEKKVSLKGVLLWIGLILALVGPIITLLGFNDNFSIVRLAAICGILGPAIPSAIGYLGFILLPNAPTVEFYAGITLTIVGFVIILISKIIEKIKK